MGARMTDSALNGYEEVPGQPGTYRRKVTLAHVGGEDLGEIDAPRPKSDERAERELQALCEQDLGLRGYKRMTAHNAFAWHTGTDIAGWFFRYPGKRAIGCPLMPDLAVWDAMLARPGLFVELKVMPIHWRHGQREMVEAGAWKLATTFDEWAAIRAAWEGGE